MSTNLRILHDLISMVQPGKYPLTATAQRKNRHGRNEILKTSQIMHENEIANKVVGIVLELHKALGPGLLESAYKACLFYKIVQSGMPVEKEKPMPLIFENVKLECGYRLDILVDNKLVLEIKSVDALNDVHLAQTLTYMKLGNYRLGLLINFNVALIKDGIRRVVNGL